MEEYFKQLPKNENPLDQYYALVARLRPAVRKMYLQIQLPSTFLTTIEEKIRMNQPLDPPEIWWPWWLHFRDYLLGICAKYPENDTIRTIHDLLAERGRIPLTEKYDILL